MSENVETVIKIRADTSDFMAGINDVLSATMKIGKVRKQTLDQSVAQTKEDVKALPSIRQRLREVSKINEQLDIRSQLYQEEANLRREQAQSMRTELNLRVSDAKTFREYLKLEAEANFYTEERLDLLASLTKIQEGIMNARERERLLVNEQRDAEKELKYLRESLADVNLIKQEEDLVILNAKKLELEKELIGVLKEQDKVRNPAQLNRKRQLTDMQIIEKAAQNVKDEYFQLERAIIGAEKAFDPQQAEKYIKAQQKLIASTRKGLDFENIGKSQAVDLSNLKQREKEIKGTIAAIEERNNAYVEDSKAAMRAKVVEEQLVLVGKELDEVRADNVITIGGYLMEQKSLNEELVAARINEGEALDILESKKETIDALIKGYHKYQNIGLKPTEDGLRTIVDLVKKQLESTKAVEGEIIVFEDLAKALETTKLNVKDTVLNFDKLKSVLESGTDRAKSFYNFVDKRTKKFDFFNYRENKKNLENLKRDMQEQANIIRENEREIAAANKRMLNVTQDKAGRDRAGADMTIGGKDYKKGQMIPADYRKDSEKIIEQKEKENKIIADGLKDQQAQASHLQGEIKGTQMAYATMAAAAVGALNYIKNATPELGAQMTIVNHEFRLMAREIGRELLPMFKAFASAAKSMRQWFKEQPDFVKKSIGVFFMLVSAMLVLGSVVATISFAFGGLATIFGTVAGAATTLGAAFKILAGGKAAVAAASAGGAKGAGLAKVLSGIGTVIGKVIGVVTGLSAGMAALVIAVVAVAAFLPQIFDLFQKGFESSSNVVKGFTGVLGIVIAPIMLLGATLRSIIKPIYDFFKALFSGASVGEAFAIAVDSFKEIWQGFYDYLSGSVGAVIEVFTDVKDGITNALTGLFDKINLGELASNALEFLADSGIIDIYNNALQAVYDFGAGIVEFLTLDGGEIEAALLGLLSPILRYKIDLPPLATGTMEVPQDMDARIHKGEMVIPATFAEGIRNMMNGTGGAAASNVNLTFNVQVVEAGNADLVAKKVTDQVMDEINRQVNWQ